MSFGEPNNPYGPPQQQPPSAPQPQPQPPAGPGYGYPQQGPPPQGYGVPQAPPYPQQGYPQYPGGADPHYQGGGYHGGPQTMPGITRAARIMLGLVVLAHVIVAGSYFWVLSRWDEEMADAGISGDANAEQFADIGKGVVVFFACLAIVFAVLGLVLLLQYAKGGNGVRVCSIVYGSFAIVTGIFMLTAYGLGLLLMAVAIMLIVFSAKRPTAEWFRRPRH
ncbi:proline-rich domain-containing protein [Streptomyces sp. NPDC002328]|uniref:proline-rich domain-containing protein n=1 Tax=Streptomyces sp. NPDC002328 TaxID=3364642 RepID=UPI0036B2E8D0